MSDGYRFVNDLTGEQWAWEGIENKSRSGGRLLAGIQLQDCECVSGKRWWENSSNAHTKRFGEITVEMSIKWDLHNNFIKRRRSAIPKDNLQSTQSTMNM